MYVLRNLELIIPAIYANLMLLAYNSYLKGVEDFSVEFGKPIAKLKGYLSLKHVEQRA